MLIYQYNNYFEEMKRIFFLPLIVCCLFSGCSSTRNFERSKSDVKLFVGSWTGTNRLEYDLTMWVQERFANGTYSIIFFNIDGNEVHQSVETGKWWIKEGHFYELRNGLNEPEIYSYAIVSRDIITFNSIRVDYEFTDQRITEDCFNFHEIIEEL